MDIAGFIINMSSWALFILIIVFSMVISGAGFLWARKQVKRGKVPAKTALNTAVTAILSLLAFLLAFIFSMTAERFGDRKNLVIEQANAIGTCYLRSSFLPDKQKLATRKIFREYVNILKGEHTDETRSQALNRLNELNLLLWEQAATLDRENLDSQIRALYISSLNEVIDIAEKRNTVALVFRLSGMLWISLMLLSTFAMFSIGFQAGLAGKANYLQFTFLAASFALVIVLIADMDSTGAHRFKVSQKPVMDLDEMMHSKIP